MLNTEGYFSQYCSLLNISALIEEDVFHFRCLRKLPGACLKHLRFIARIIKMMCLKTNQTCVWAVPLPELHLLSCVSQTFSI